MKTKFFFVVASVLLLCHTAIAQSPSLLRAKNVRTVEGANSSAGKGHNVITDANGNVYTIGFAAGTKDIVIQKSGASGNVIWAKSVRLDKALNGSFTASRSGASGNVYTKRALARTTDFDQEASGVTTTP